MKKLILTATLIMVAGLAFAQPGHRGMDRPWRHGDQHPREMVQSFRLFKLTEALNLSEDQTVKIFPLIADMNQQHEEAQEAMQEKMKELRELLGEDKVNTRKASALALQIHEMRGEMQAKMHDHQGQLLDLLDDEQKAEFMLFNHQFDKHLRGLKERMHHHGDGDGPGRFGDGPGHGRRGNDGPRRR